MCGIVGFCDFSKKSNKQTLVKMTDILHHRGPDDSGYSFYENEFAHIGLGHRRLSILDLSEHGHQPMIYQNLTIIYNGEVYNFKEIKKELEILGYVFESDSDTEVILKAFHKWGLKSVDKFRGMFVFSIYDKERKVIYIFRDRVGVKPLYYYTKDGLFLYASELKAFYQHAKFEKSINRNSLSLYLQYGYITAPYSIFNDTYKLKASHYLKYDLENNSFEIKEYWSLLDCYTKDKINISYEKAKDKLENILIDSFSLRMISDVSIGTFLSGGVDSSLVTAVLQSNSTKPIKTFTIGFDEEDYNEANYASKIAKYLGTEHTEYYCSKCEAMEIIKLLPQIYDEPFGDSSSIPTILISRIAKNKVTVVLSGDGGDELFNGYPSYSLFEKRYNVIQKIPFKDILIKILNVSKIDLILKKLNKAYYLKYLKFRNILEHKELSNMFKVSNSVFTKYEIEELLSNHYFFQPNNVNLRINNIEQMMISDFQNFLADDVLVKVDRASMSVSLESREPLLDHKIIEFASALPIEYKKDKKILKDILGKYLPRELFERKKAGFSIPINNWMRNELKYLIDQYLDDNFIEKEGIFDLSYIKCLKDDFYKGDNDDRKVWTILMFQMWYQENFNAI